MYAICEVLQSLLLFVCTGILLLLSNCLGFCILCSFSGVWTLRELVWVCELCFVFWCNFSLWFLLLSCFSRDRGQALIGLGNFMVLSVVLIIGCLL